MSPETITSPNTFLQIKLGIWQIGFVAAERMAAAASNAEKTGQSS